MGLAAPKNKIKISHDPNNTRWTNDTSSFGHKIMTSQGWQPGQYLGAKDAAHAEFHTAANASHIRVSIKDDNLGLGAKIGSGVGHGECTGLDAFKDLLGRLNGKDEDEIIKEQKSREALKVAIYSERKWGSTRFVSGGFLIGDKIQYLIDAEAERIRKIALGSSSESSSDSSSESEEEEKVVEKPKKSKKRKIEVLEEPEVVAVTVKKSKKERKADTAATTKVASESIEKKHSKKSKKDRKSKPETDDTPDEAELKRRRKQEKKEKKERKEKSKAKADNTEEEPEKKKKSKKDKHKEAEDSSEPSLHVTKESTPRVPESSGRSTPIMMQGRHAVRARNIAQKRMASMDVASLNQIFMIKSQ